MSFSAMMMLVVTTILANNVVLSQFLGICSFLGVSQKTETASGMGGALTFVLTLASFVCGVLYHLVLVPFHLEYLRTIVFILIGVPIGYSLGGAGAGAVRGDVPEEVHALPL